MTAADRKAPNFFLPDFCAGRTTLAIVLILELVALVIALARQAIHDNFWVDLASASMFLLWLGLGCAWVLCSARPWLAAMTTPRASTLALALITGVVALVSEATFQVGRFVTGGEPDSAGVFPAQHADFLLRNVSMGFIVSALLLRYFYISAERKRAIELEAQARIRALQARIRPHFLFNSMNTIAALTRSNPKQAEQAVEDLADLFRASLSDAKQQIRLSEEIEVARVYERIERLRMGERLRVAWHIDALPMDAMVPSLLLQPLLENAIYHGIERLPNGGEVVVAAQVSDGSIDLCVANPTANEPGASRDGNKLALDNIAQRLELAWPGRASVSVDQSPGCYKVTLRFPYQQRVDSAAS